MKLDKVVILTENTDYGIPAAEKHDRASSTSAGIASVTFSVDIGTQDFAGIIERVKAESPDMIVTLATGEASYNFTPASRPDAGIGPQNVPTMCNQVSLVSDAFWTNVPRRQPLLRAPHRPAPAALQRRGPGPRSRVLGTHWQGRHRVLRNGLLRLHHADRPGHRGLRLPPTRPTLSTPSRTSTTWARSVRSPSPLIAAIPPIRPVSTPSGGTSSLIPPSRSSSTRLKGRDATETTVVYPVIYQTGAPIIVGQE